jgi:hypothetical protein
MVNVERFQFLLDKNEILIAPSAALAIPEGSDPGEAALRSRARIQKESRNFQAVLSFARKNSRLMEELCDLYIFASPPERSKMRDLIASRHKWRAAFLFWRAPNPQERARTTHIVGQGSSDGMERTLLFFLAALSLVGGARGIRETLTTLTENWNQAEEAGLDPEPLYRQALEWGGELAPQLATVLNSDRRAGFSLSPRKSVGQL